MFINKIKKYNKKILVALMILSVFMPKKNFALADSLIKTSLEEADFYESCDANITTNDGLYDLSEFEHIVVLQEQGWIWVYASMQDITWKVDGTGGSSGQLNLKSAIKFNTRQGYPHNTNNITPCELVEDGYTYDYYANDQRSFILYTSKDMNFDNSEEIAFFKSLDYYAKPNSIAPNVVPTMPIDKYAPGSWARGQERWAYPYYIVAQRFPTSYTFYCSTQPFYIDNTTGNIHLSGDAIMYHGTVQTGSDDILWHTREVITSSRTELVHLLKKPKVLYNSHDVLETDVWPSNISKSYVVDNTTNIVIIPANPIPYTTNSIIEREYTNDIPAPRIKGINPEKKLWFESFKDFYVQWYPVTGKNYKLELEYELTNEWELNNGKRYDPNPWSDVHKGQTYNSMSDFHKKIFGGRIEDRDGYIYFNNEKISNAILLYRIGAQYVDSQTAGYYNISYLKMRYVDTETIVTGNVTHTSKINYGPWTTVRFILDSDTSLIEYDTEIQELVDYIIDPETGEIIEVYDVQEGSQQQGYDVGEGIRDPEAFQIGIDGGLADATRTINEVGNWVGQIPSFLGQLFSFLPVEIIAFIGFGIVLLIILRVVGR